MSDTRVHTSSDLVRQIGVISSVVFMIIAAMVGTGLFGGTNVRDLQGGALDADATYLAPATQAFSIWTAIYVLMVAYAVWQALPAQRARDRQRAAGWWVALTAVLNGFWLLTAQFLNLPLTVVSIVVLLIALGLTIRVLTREPRDGWQDVVFLDLTVGLHLGWVALATVANITAWLTAQVVPASWEDAADFWGIAVLVVVGFIGIGIALGTHGRIAPGVAMAWGLAWIAIGRTTGEPESLPIAITAWIVAVVVVTVPLAIRLLVSRGTPD